MFPSHFMFYILIIVLSIIISQLFVVKDQYSDYNTVVLNQLASVVLNTKNILYDFKDFYASGSIDFSQYHLVSHYLTISDIECIMNETNAIQTCSSYNINDISVPTSITNIVFKKYACTDREYGTNNEQCKIRILNYDYVFNRTCLNMVVNTIKKLDVNKFLVTFKNDLSAQLFMLLRPMYLTTSMSYMYKVKYENNPIHYNTNNNCPRNYTSTDSLFNLIIEKVDDEKIYPNKFLLDIDRIRDYEVRNANTVCSDVIDVTQYLQKDGNMTDSIGNTSFPCSINVYYLSLDQRSKISADLTNSMTLFFNINTAEMGASKKMFEMRRSSEGTQQVCKTFAVTLVNDAIKYLSITLNEMSSLTYVFVLPTEHTIFDIFVTYSINMIQIYCFYGSDSFKYEIYETSLVSSWSIKNINEASSYYKCSVPPAALPANSYNIPSFYDVVTKMKLI